MYCCKLHYKDGTSYIPRFTYEKMAGPVMRWCEMFSQADCVNYAELIEVQDETTED